MVSCLGWVCVAYWFGFLLDIAPPKSIMLEALRGGRTEAIQGVSRDDGEENESYYLGLRA